MSSEGDRSTPAPSGLDPAVLTPTRAAGYDQQRREKLAAFVAAGDADDSPEPEAPESYEVAEDPGETVDEAVDPQAQADPEHADTDPVEPEAVTQVPEEPEGEPQDDLADPQEPEAEVEEAQPDVEPAEPKPFSVVGPDGQPVDLPDGLTFTYTADGAERTRSLDEVIKYAQLGENFGRRSRELAQRQQELEANARSHADQLNQQFQEAYNSMVSTIRRFFEDEDYREEALNEWYRITSNPEELQLRIAAQEGARARQELERYRAQQQQDFERKVWATVDTILTEQLADYDPELREGLAQRIKSRYGTDLRTRGTEVLSENYLIALITEERSIIDQAVARAKAEAERAIVPRVAQAKAEAVVKTQNQVTDRAIQRQKVVRTAPKTTAAPSPQRAAPKIRSLNDARRALKEWQNG